MRSALLAKSYVYNSGIADDSWFLEFTGLALLKLCAHGVVTPICPLPHRPATTVSLCDPHCADTCTDCASAMVGAAGVRVRIKAAALCSFNKRKVKVLDEAVKMIHFTKSVKPMPSF